MPIKPTKMTEGTTKVVTLEMSVDLFNQIVEAALLNERTVSGEIRFAVKKHLDSM